MTSTFSPHFEILPAARELFGPAFQPSESLKAMVYFDDGDLKVLSRDDRIALVNAVSAVRELPTVKVLSSKLAAKVNLL